MYSDLGLIEDFEINQVVLRRFLVSETIPRNISLIKQPLHIHDSVFSFLEFKPVSFDFFFIFLLRLVDAHLILTVVGTQFLGDALLCAQCVVIVYH